MGKILRRCDKCKGFHAAYLIDDPQLGRLRLCYRCWHAAHQAAQPVNERKPVEEEIPQPGIDKDDVDMHSQLRSA